MLNLNYVNAETKAEALELLKKEGETICLVAGATNILPYIVTKTLSDKTLVNIKNIKDLCGIKENKDNIVIGAATTISEIEKSDVIKANALALYQAAAEFADPITRNNATIAGNIADASPASDTSPALLALDAVVLVENAKGERRIPISEFFQGVRKTALKHDELIVALEIPKNKANQYSQFIKMGLRKSMAISIATIAVSADLTNGKFNDIKVAIGSCAPTPVRAKALEKALLGKAADETAIDAAIPEILKDINPIDDIRASADYRKEIAGPLFKKAYKRIVNCQK